MYGETENRSNQLALAKAIKRKMHCLDRELPLMGKSQKSKWAFKSEGCSRQVGDEVGGRACPALET